MNKLLWLLLLLFTTVHANTNLWIATGRAYGIEPRLLYAISKIESNVSPLLVSVNFQKLSSQQYKNLHKVLNYKNIPYKILSKVIQIQNRNITEAKEIIYFLDKYGYPSFDIGLMQINNIHKQTLLNKNIELYDLLSEKTNMEVGAEILWDCYKKHRSASKAINAYNGNIVGNDYYAKVSAEFRKLLLPHENSSKSLFYRVL